MIFSQGQFTNAANATPEEIARKREMLAMLMPRYGEAKYVGQGLGQLAMGIGQGIQNRKLSRAEGEGRAGAVERFKALMGGGAAQPASAPVGASGGSYAPRDMTGASGFTMRPDTPNPGALPASIISAVDRVAPNAAQPASGDAISARLMADLQRDLGLTPEQSAGFVGNLAHETGGFKHRQEIAPVVPGSRGGTGFAQWTGPRRVAFENWAMEQGLDPASYEANYGFLKHELQNTPEGAVLDPLRAATTPQDAARVVSDKFLRPGVPNTDSRMAFADQFAEGSPTQADYSTSPQMTGAAIPTEALIGIMSDPWSTPEQKAIAQQMYDDQRKMSDPAYLRGMRADELDIQKSELELQQMQQPGGNTEYGLQPQYGVDAQGNPVMIQVGKDGSAVQTKLPDGVTFQKEPIKVDAGTDWILLDPISRQPVGSIPKNLGAAAAETAAGKALGEDQALLDSTSSKMAGLQDVVAQLEVLADKATYTTGGQVLDYGMKQLGMEPREAAIARAEYIAKVDNQVLPMLRDTFGAAFTVKEGETLRATLGDPDKSPAEKKAVLRAFIEQKKRDMEALQTRTGQTGVTGAGANFSAMGLAEIGQVDIGKLSPAEMDALEIRMKELGL